MTQSEFIINLRTDMTEAERRLWYQLRQRQLKGYLFRRQAPMKKYVVDFVCHKAKLIIELDGGHHSINLRHDNRRTAWLNLQGYQVLRFWNNEVMDNLESVTEIILINLADRTKSPPP